jgi:hypothetical protein
MFVEFETDTGAKTVRASVVPNYIPIRGLSDDPAKSVGDSIVHRYLGSSGHREILRRDDPFV